MGRFGVRAHYWGPTLVVVVTGDVDADAAVVLGSQLRRLQRDCDVLVDLWDVTRLDSVAVDTLLGAKHRSDEAGWGFVLVADPKGPCSEAIERAGEAGLAAYPTRQAAKSALSLLDD